MTKVRIEMPPGHDNAWLLVLKYGKSGVNAPINSSANVVKPTASVPPEHAARACFQRRTGIIIRNHASDALADPTNNTNSEETFFAKIIKITM